MLLIMLKYLKTQYRTYRKCTRSPELEILPYTGHTVVVPTLSVLEGVHCIQKLTRMSHNETFIGLQCSYVAVALLTYG